MHIIVVFGLGSTKPCMETSTEIRRVTYGLLTGAFSLASLKIISVSKSEIWNIKGTLCHTQRKPKGLVGYQHVSVDDLQLSTTYYTTKNTNNSAVHAKG